jgi:hypothetical protein
MSRPLVLAAACALLAGCQTIRPGTPERLAACDQRIATFGKTRPGRMNADEWAEPSWRGFRSMFDKDGDGRVDLSEFMRSTGAVENPKWHRRLFDKLDAGHKGFIDRNDILRDNRGSFRMVDLNRDGWIDQAECAAIHPYPLELV